MRITETHEWLEDDRTPSKFGLTRKALSELGEIVYIELPKVGTVLKQGELLAVLESTKAAIDIYSPVDGEVHSVNTALLSDLSPLNEDPEKTGWLVAFESSAR